MREMTVPDAGSAGDSGQMRTWRDPLTPLSRASRRRWATAYGLLLTAGGAVPHGRRGLG